jgi:RNA polymerase sigma-70 factor (ECF subfamily)
MKPGSCGQATLNDKAIESIGRALVSHLPGLRRYATALTGSTSAADDLVQDCIERALRRADSLQDHSKMAAWLRTILHNLHLDELRRRRGRGTGVDLDEMENDIALSTMPEDRAAAADLVRAMATLSAEHRQILLLVGLEDLSYREIADELGLPLGTVMSRLARARERLRREMEDRAAPGTVMAFPRQERAL